MFQFDHHTYDPATGEVEGPRGSARLQPKPARLLAMLLEARGSLVEREAIRTALWPDTNVDFDAGLNTCVRQIRTALGDTGGEPEWIETLPKRGYRAAVEVQGGAEGESPAAAAPREPDTGGVSLVREVTPYVAMFLVLAFGTAVVLWNELFLAAAPAGTPAGTTGETTATDGSERASEAPLRLALLPFVDPEADDPGSFNRSLTEAYLTALVSAAPNRFVVIGPATTAPLLQGVATLAQIAAAVEADFVIHGGHRARDSMFFVEVVHPDGAHLFARRFELAVEDGPEPPPDLIADITAAMLAAPSR